MTPSKTTPVTVARGDGIGPEITDAVLHVLERAGAALDIEEIDIGERVYLAGEPTGISTAAWDSLRRTGVLLKGPITTPQGGGYKSLNVTIRNTLGLFANIRPVRSYAPYVATNHPTMDLVIVRENEEDLYAGIEHQQTDEVVQSLKLISRPGSERIIRYAFEYARRRPRKKLACMVKDNIMKLSDGLFRKIFHEVHREFPDVEADHYIIDIGMARVADQPERFDVIVVPNLYGDILSDIAAEVSGSVGMAGSANIGEHFAMFEAIHGSAPDIAGRGVANPSGLLHGAVKMLLHIGQGDVAEAIHNGWLRTVEEGIHTIDVYRKGRSERRAGTREFAEAVVARLGQKPRNLAPAVYERDSIPIPSVKRRPAARKDFLGVDVFLDSRSEDAEAFGNALRELTPVGWTLRYITNRGATVWPAGHAETLLTDHWRCRFLSTDPKTRTTDAALELLRRLAQAGHAFVKVENLYAFDGKPAFSGPSDP